MSYQRFILTSGATSETLTINPDGWDKWGQMWQRDKVYWGVFQSYTPQSYRFAIKHGGGGDFIKSEYETNGIFAQMTISVYTRNTQTNDYDFSYTGNLNFDPSKFKLERDYVEIGFVASSDMQNFITRDEIEMDINDLVSVDGIAMNGFESSPKDVLFKKVDILKEASISYQINPDETLVLTDSDRVNKYPAFWADNVYKNTLLDELLFLNGPEVEIRSQTLYRNNSTLLEILTINYISASSWYLTVTNGEADRFEHCTLKLMFDKYVNDVLSTSDIVWDSGYLDLYDPEQSVITYELQPDISSLIGQSYELLENDRIDLYFKLSLVGGYFIGGTVIALTSILSGFMELEVKSLGKMDSNVKCFFPHEAFTRMFQKILSKNAAFSSAFLGRTDSEFSAYAANGEGSLDAITTGWNLRGFPTSKFLLKFKDLFKSFDAIYNLMLGYAPITGIFYIDQKSRAFDSTYYMFDLGEVDELKISPYKDCFFNEIISGYEEDGNFEDFQGANEFNVQTGHSTIIPLKDKLDIRSKYNTDTVGMELARRKDYVHFSAEDTDQDDKIFIVRTDGTQTVQGGNGLSGFLGIEQYYNVALTPRENIIRWADYIKGAFFRPENSDFTIKFQSSKKNVDITYVNQNGDTVTEHQDITNFGDMASVIRLFNAEYYELKGIFREQFAAILRLNPHGLITFTFDGVAYEGFIDEVQTEDYNQKAPYKLIAHESATDVQKVFMDGDNAMFMYDSYHKFI